MSAAGEDEAVRVRTLYKSLQTPPLMFYVPLQVFVIEVAFFMFLASQIQFFAIAAVPAHIIPVVLTRTNPAWVRDIYLNIRYYWLTPARGLYNRFTVSLTAQRLRHRFGRRPY